MDKNIINQKASMMKTIQNATRDEMIIMMTRLIEGHPLLVAGMINRIEFSLVKDFASSSGFFIPGKKVEDILFHVFVSNNKIRGIKSFTTYVTNEHGVKPHLKDSKKAVEDIITLYMDQRDELIKTLSNHSIQSDIDDLNINGLSNSADYVDDIPDVQADLPPHVTKMVESFVTVDMQDGERLDFNGHQLIWSKDKWITDPNPPPSPSSTVIGPMSGVPIQTTTVHRPTNDDDVVGYGFFE